MALTGYQRDEKVATFLREQLNAIYGSSFANVIERELESRLGLDLYDSLRTRLSDAVKVLCRMFKGEKTVIIIFETLIGELRELGASPESQELVPLLERGMETLAGLP